MRSGATAIQGLVRRRVQEHLDPASVPGLFAWWAADRITGLNDGDPVSLWQGGNGVDLVGADPNRPTYRTNVLNGLPAVRFIDVPPSKLVGPNVIWNPYRPYALIAVGRIITPPTLGINFLNNYLGTATPGDGQCIFVFAAAGATYGGVLAVIETDEIGPPYPVIEPVIGGRTLPYSDPFSFGISYNGKGGAGVRSNANLAWTDLPTQFSASVNGQSYPSLLDFGGAYIEGGVSRFPNGPPFDPNQGNSQPLNMGSYGIGNGPSSGDIHEVIFYDRYLPYETLRGIELGLRKKYNLKR